MKRCTGGNGETHREGQRNAGEGGEKHQQERLTRKHTNTVTKKQTFQKPLEKTTPLIHNAVMHEQINGQNFV